MSVTEPQVEPVARKKRASEELPPTIPIKVERSIATKAKAIATDRGIDASDYVSELLRSAVERDWAKLVKRIDSSEGHKK